jgi:hypothetical protein
MPNSASRLFDTAVLMSISHRLLILPSPQHGGEENRFGHYRFMGSRPETLDAGQHLSTDSQPADHMNEIVLGFWQLGPLLSASSSEVMDKTKHTILSKKSSVGIQHQYEENVQKQIDFLECFSSKNNPRILTK